MTLIRSIVQPGACTPFIHPLLRTILFSKLPVFETLLWCWGNGRTKHTTPLPSGGSHSNGETYSKTDEEMDTPCWVVKNARG